MGDKNTESKKTKVKEEVEYFTDEMHSSIFLFPETISSRYTSSCKAVTNGVKFGKNRKK